MHKGKNGPMCCIGYSALSFDINFARLLAAFGVF